MRQSLGPGGDDMERRAILAAALAVVVLLVYQAYFVSAPPPPPEPKKEAADEAKPAPAIPAAGPRATRERLAGPLRRGERDETVHMETDLVSVTLTNRGGGIRNWQLKQYRENYGPLDLVGDPPSGGAPLPFTAWIEGGEGSTGLYRVVERPTGDPGVPQRVVMEFQEAGGVLLQKTLVLHPGRYLADATLRLVNPGARPSQIALRVEWGPGFRMGPGAPEIGGISAAAWIDGKLAVPDLEKVKGGEELAQSGSVSWAAVQDRYFAAALIPVEPAPSSLVRKEAPERLVVGLRYPALTIPPGGEIRVPLKLYAGPKEIGRLGDAGHDLQGLVDLGWFWFLAQPALWLLTRLHDATGNYGVAIIIITVLQKIGFYPLTQKSYKSMQAMQAIQPKLEALKERYKGNTQKLNQEMMELYKRHGVNPFGGCLPMVIQIPIFIALYNALGSSVELWRAPFALWITDLSAPDTFFVVPFAIPYLGAAFAFRGLPLIMGISMFVQQKMSPTAGDPRQAQMMLYLMPVMFTFIFWGMPSGLVLYWLVNNVLQIGHQYQMNRGLGLSLGAAKEGG